MTPPDINFKHLLLTRFNLDYSQRKGLPYQCDEEWHRHRFKLFLTYCLPSVAQQTCQNFEWIIFFNDDEKESYPSFLNETENRLENLRFLIVKPTEDHREILKTFIQDNYSIDYLITTRIDNDDSISKYFIEAIQKKFLEYYPSIKGECLINPKTGYRLETRFPFRKTVFHGYQYAPFVTLFSERKSSNEINTILKYGHHQWTDSTVSQELQGGPYWIQIVHQRNRSNRILSLTFTLQISEDHFPVLKGTFINRYWFGFFMFPIHLFITGIQRILNKIRNG